MGKLGSRGHEIQGIPDQQSDQGKGLWWVGKVGLVVVGWVAINIHQK